MGPLPNELLRLSATLALLAAFAPGCRVESTTIHDHEGDGGSTEQAGTSGDLQAGTAGEATQGTGGTEASGGTAGSGGQPEATGGASTGGAAAAVAGSAGSVNAGSGNAGAAGAGEAAGNGGTGGTAETGGAAGAVANAGAAGSDGTLCFGDTSTLTGDPIELCDSLRYADQTCPEGSAGDIAAANEMCQYMAKNVRAGVFEVMYGCLSLLTTDDVCGSLDDTVINCRNIAFANACPVDQLVEGVDDYTCADIQAKEGCSSDPVPVETCEGTLFGFNDKVRENIIYCFECQDPVEEGDTADCLDVFAECAFPDGVGAGDYPYPGDCS